MSFVTGKDCLDLAAIAAKIGGCEVRWVRGALGHSMSLTRMIHHCIDHDSVGCLEVTVDWMQKRCPKSNCPRWNAQIERKTLVAQVLHSY